MITDPLSARTLSAYPLSVGTSLAFESIFETDNPSIDPDRKIPQKIDITKYNQLWVNVGTLFRNIYNAVPKEDIFKVSYESFTQTIFFEIDVINSLLINEGGDVCKPHYYVCSYNKAVDTTKQKYVSVRTDTTEKQKLYTGMFNKSVQHFLSNVDKDSNVHLFDSTIKPPERSNALIITHFAYDLLSSNNFYKLDLLETHTGVLKQKHEWHTKFLNGKDLNMIPFNKAFIRIFGDKEHFSPMNIKTRNTIIELAKQSNWSQITTKDKILFDLDLKLKDVYLREVIKGLF